MSYLSGESGFIIKAHTTWIHLPVTRSASLFTQPMSHTSFHCFQAMFMSSSPQTCLPLPTQHMCSDFSPCSDSPVCPSCPHTCSHFSRQICSHWVSPQLLLDPQSAVHYLYQLFVPSLCILLFLFLFWYIIPVKLLLVLST